MVSVPNPLYAQALDIRPLASTLETVPTVEKTVKLYNTLTRQKEEFVPGDPDCITMYVCGPTVYNYAHIGNARPVVVFDLLYRLLRRRFPKVIYARNITDVDDKIIEASRQSGESIDQITERYTRAYDEDTAALGALPPDLKPRATDHMTPMIEMIQTLIDSGNAYEADGHVLFDVTAYEDYGKLSKRTLKELLAGARVDVAPYKRNPGDFVLWKPSNEDQPGWESPWGLGRPGWHIECSAMAAAHLGKTIDIHGGGIDLVFPHHENELAQSQCAHGETFVRYWMHNGFLTMDKDKMSKSLGNVLTIHELREVIPGEVLRLVLMSAHYRQPLDWSDDTVAQQRERLDRMYRALRDLGDVQADENAEPSGELMAALEDDLNTPLALSVLASLINRANAASDEAERRELKGTILASAEMLGLLQEDPDHWLQGASRHDLDTDEIEQLIAQRNQARKDRDFATADQIRDQLAEKGVIIEDGPDGTRWRFDR